MKVGIVGATGYGGIELFRLLKKHPYIDELTLYSSSQAGEYFETIYPNMLNDESYKLEHVNADLMKEELDVVFLATPAGVSSNLTPKLIGGSTKIIDLSGDLRLKDTADYEQWYKKPPASESILSQSVYGLPEWNREQIKEANVIANPGCYPTATLLGIAPLIVEEIIDFSSIIIDAKSGVSGAGKNPNPLIHFAHAQENLQIYKVNQHQHIPEIEQQLKLWGSGEPVTFSTHLVPMTRGIMSTIYVKLNDAYSEDELLDIYNAYYDEQPFVRVRKDGSFPCTKDVYGSNYCDIGLTLDPRTNRVTIVSVIDNLMKGAASQAIQNMNLLFKFDENAGLPEVPVYP